MERGVYQKIYDSLNSFEDVERISHRFQLPAGVVASILDQKTVARVRRDHSRVASRGRRHLHAWKRGDSMLEIARKNKIPATLMVSVILKEMECPHKEMIKNPNDIRDERLRLEVMEALESDIFFSPRAHRLQAEKGRMGESMIGKWLEVNDISYRSEEDLRKSGMDKTPDFLLDDTLLVDGVEVSWVESKALFGSEGEHERYLKKQFMPYEERYGRGMVVYWHGFIDSISMECGLIKDHSFFCGIDDDVEKFLDSTFKS